MNEDNIEWLRKELNLTAERAKAEGLTPAEFMAGMWAYLQNFKDDYADELPDETDETDE